MDSVTLRMVGCCNEGGGGWFTVDFSDLESDEPRRSKRLRLLSQVSLNQGAGRTKNAEHTTHLPQQLNGRGAWECKALQRMSCVEWCTKITLREHFLQQAREREPGVVA